MPGKSTAQISNTWEIYEGENYREYWEDRQYEDAAERIALSHLLPSIGGQLIDLGANYGRLASLYSTFDQVILTDGAKSAILQAKESFSGTKYHCIVNDLRRTPLPSNLFDVVITISTFHYLPQVGPAFAEARRLLKDGGLFIFEFANKRTIKQLALSTIGKSQVEPRDLQPIQAEYYIKYHPQYIMNYLDEYGFECDKRLGTSLLRWRPLKSTLPHWLLVALDSRTQSLNGNLFLGPSIFIRARKS